MGIVTVVVVVVDDLSSAHVYLRLKQGQTIDDIPEEVLRECCQLVKANSIKGNKLDDVGVIYTSFLNLRKEDHMVAGEVGYFNEKLVKRTRVGTRDGPLLRKLEKTKRELFPDLRKDREERDAEEKSKAMAEKKQSAKAEHERKKEEKRKAVEEAAKREYRDIFANEDAKTKTSDMKKMTAQQYEEEEFW